MKKMITYFVCGMMLMLFIGNNVQSKESYQFNLKPTWENIYYLAKVMYAENGSGTDETVILTGIVVTERVRSEQYPNTIKGVISQKGQYSTWIDGKIQKCEPDERCLEIAEEILRYKLWKKYPKNLVFQSMFKQGKSTYMVINNEYFCLA